MARSCHPRAHLLPTDHLFQGVTSFRELETRISALPEELDRGDAFEVFVEAYLHTDVRWQVADLWLVGAIPLEIRTTLNLPHNAIGIDGVFRTHAGDVVPYQVKFRRGRPLVGVEDVATFFTVTDRATHRVLISNSSRHAPDVVKRDRLRMLRGSDFDALTAEDFAAIAGWLNQTPVTRHRATPREDQQNALTRIAETLTTADRATVVMPCGTGKTLVQLWAAEQQHPQTVLVLVPSLALLGQTLDEWSRHSALGERLEYLCVCSDPTVSTDQDALRVTSADVPFPVDTDPAVVRRFLDRPVTRTMRVVFSTYQSTPVVAEGLRGLAPFDLGIFDEAHKTVGERGGVFAFALDDARIAVRKRLFFTATPRHILRTRDKEGDFRVVSMDDPAVYGVRAYTQTFAAAIERGIICDYRVVVSVVDPAEVTAFALQHGITIVEGDAQATQWVANQIAVSKAIVETGAQKVITFHGRVALAKAFAGDPPRGIRQHLDEFLVHHVNGEMRVSDRRDILSGFRDAQKRLVTNARCLTEGVDLPAVDMVVFSSPRKSKVDIIQAVGRAMRTPREVTKTLGYVVVPILLAPHQTDDVQDASRDTDWEDIVDVLAALRDHDTRLEELVRDLQVAKGRGDVFNPRAFADRIQVIGALVGLDQLTRSIGAVVLARLGLSWDEWYGQLASFKDREGHCKVPQGNEKQASLAAWVQHQRQLYKRGKLSKERIARLSALGFVWDLLEANWEEQYQALAAFKAREGHCDVSFATPELKTLAGWLGHQRQAYKQGRLPAEKITRLNLIGVVWDPLDQAWEHQYQTLAAFKAREGHCNVPFGYAENPSLGQWVNQQKVKYRKGSLSKDRAARLTALGLVWDLLDLNWEQQYQALAAFRAREGHCDVPIGSVQNLQLRKWLQNQRRRYKVGKMPPDRIERLNALDVIWAMADVAWEAQYRSLLEFRERTGHCNVSQTDSSNSKLGKWLSHQRQAYKQGRLPAERITQLSELGVVWDHLEQAWEHQYQALVAFKEREGHCNVPYRFPENPELRAWLNQQRVRTKQGKVSKERVARLSALGVVWDLLEANWEEQYQALAAFKASEGHCDVTHSASLELGRWVNFVRSRHRLGKLSADRVARLDALGFSWNPRKKTRRLASGVYARELTNSDGTSD